jgi:hypothetical protein
MDLFCRVPVSMTAAALGGEIEVPTIDGGRSRVKVPAGSQSGKQMRLRGKGMPQLRGGRVRATCIIELAGRDAGALIFSTVSGGVVCGWLLWIGGRSFSPSKPCV